MPPVSRRRWIRACMAGALSMSPCAIASLMRGRSCITSRPAPMLRCPTSEFPICPGGSPTSLPDVRRKAWGQLAHSRSNVGVCACRMALSAASSRQPQPSSTTSITGRRFCISIFPVSCGPRQAADALRSGGLCGIAASSSTSRTAADRSLRFRRWSLADRACLSCHMTANSARAVGGCCGTRINPVPRIR